MNYIKYNPHIVLKNMVRSSQNNYKYTCFDILDEYINIHDIYNLFMNCSIYTLHNILKNINIHWNIIKNTITKKYIDKLLPFLRLY